VAVQASPPRSAPRATPPHADWSRRPRQVGAPRIDRAGREPGTKLKFVVIDARRRLTAARRRSTARHGAPQGRSGSAGEGARAPIEPQRFFNVGSGPGKRTATIADASPPPTTPPTTTADDDRRPRLRRRCRCRPYPRPPPTRATRSAPHGARAPSPANTDRRGRDSLTNSQFVPGCVKAAPPSKCVRPRRAGERRLAPAAAQVGVARDTRGSSSVAAAIRAARDLAPRRLVAAAATSRRSTDRRRRPRSEVDARPRNTAGPPPTPARPPTPSDRASDRRGAT
jgi:hypothetical protein